ncbi:hypothetical protein [Paenibacillus agri]|uniref:DUF3221 domain-containing protein n=1 Tax=Paenibacillus agri TaxID=2744309 RepID=A0A850EHU5_9BACL|nr:hypothetical protein [Paenibacillus agri]NUU58984.1 hypothetical protein [Paenibacillus agri]
MKKKLLAGLLAVSACFAISSTSFAAEVTTSTTIAPAVEASEISTQDWHQVVLEMQVGETMWVSGSNFWFLYTNGGIEVGQDGKITALYPGASTVVADLGNDYTLYYTILVK